MTSSAPAELLAHYRSGKPLSYEFEQWPYYVLFWPEEKLDSLNIGYRVPVNAPGYFGFGSDGGAEMLAFSPEGSIVCLPFIGMKSAQARLLAQSWTTLEELLRSAQNRAD